MVTLLFLIGLSAAGAAEVLTLDRGVVKEDTTWSGTVIVQGRAVVKKGATLTIAPGTTVKFVWVDEDGNGIGDGELTVEGRLIAQGTRDNPITFTSAREEPRMKDWTFVMISVSRDTRVEYCRFEYAFTGLQVHFSRAVVRNSLFWRNFEGMRFSTAKVRIEHNDFRDNTYGIRYESRGSPSTVSDNTFQGNEYAFFPVLKSSSTVKIFGNNIESKNYNVKMGLKQGQDLDYSRNWWGVTDPEKIESGFFDKGKDESLGRVLYKPFLAGPVVGSGIQ